MKLKSTQVIQKRLVKSILWLILTPFLLLGLTFALIHLPPIQNWISNKITSYLTEGTGYQTEIDYVNINWFNSITADGTAIYDHHQVKMIGVEELVLSFDLKALLTESDFRTTEAWVYRADVNLRTDDTDSLNINDWARKITALTASKEKKESSSAFILDKAELIDSKFSISDSRKDSIGEGFNYNHFQLININADLLNLKAQPDSFLLDIKYLTAQDQESGMKVDEMKSYFRYSKKSMQFLDTDLKTGKSRIKDHISFYYDRPSQMSSFVDSIQIDAHLEKTIIHSDDLSYFAPEIKKFNSDLTISGDFNGSIKDFITTNFELKLGDSTQLKGNLDIEGLPDIQNAFFDVSLTNSTLLAEDITQILQEESNDFLSRLGLIYFNGEFDGFIKGFVADGDFKTALGNITSNLQIGPENDKISYDGKLSLESFDLGKLTGDSLYQLVDLNGTINGYGLQLEDANFNLLAEIDRFGINGYELKNIETDGAIAQSFFSGELSINDPNLNLFANGSIDLRNKKRAFNISGDLSMANLDSLNISKDQAQIGSKFNLDFEGIKLDSLIGHAELFESYLNYKGQLLKFDTLALRANRSDSVRSLAFQSEVINADLEGKFSYAGLLKEFNHQANRLKAQFKGDLKKASSFSLTKPEERISVKSEIELKHIDPIIHIFDTTVSISQNSSLSVLYEKSKKERFELDFNADTIQLFGAIFFDNELNLLGDHLNDLESFNSEGYFYSANQDYGDDIYTQDLNLEAVWNGLHIDLRQSINQESSGNYAELGANLDFYDGRLEISFEDSNIIALGDYWQINESNRVIVTPEIINIDQFSVYNQDQSLGLDGTLAIQKDSSQNLNIAFQNVQIQNINSLTDQNYRGLLNGTLDAKNLLYEPTFVGQVSLLNFQINDFTVGNIVGDVKWNDEETKFELGFDVTRNQQDIITFSGDIYPLKNDQLDLLLHLNNTNLEFAEPYISQYFTELGGVINGDFKVSGRIARPQFEGQGTISGGQMKINYLNTLYQFDGNMTMEESRILLSDMIFKDAFNHRAYFAGTITHDNYSDIRLDLNGDLEEFQVLNLPSNLEADFYGDAYATGNVSLIGEASNLTIEAKARTEPNTRIFIPINKNDDELEEVDYIQFIDRTDTTSAEVKINEESVDKIEIEGLNLDLDIEVTPDAYAEIIIDARTGDIIRGRGNGQLRLLIDSDGEFQMTGDLQIEEGAYNFSLYSIITKEFQIEQPSNITWFGDPYAGVMSIKAAYLENTPITPILKQAGFGNLDESTSSNSGRRVPVKVLLDLQGPLLSPEITFDIDFGDIQAQNYETITSINAFKNKIQSDEQELNRQVLSLILLGKFSEQGNVNIVGGTTTQSVSQLLSNQLSQLVAQIDENLEIDFDLRDLSDEAFNTMRLRLSYTFLEGRLRVTREGGLSNIQDVNSAVGDWTAEFLLTPDGRYKVKFYYRNNYDYTAGAISQNNAAFTTTGASITQTSSFNSFRELFQKVEKSRKAKRLEKSTKKSESSSN